MATSKKKKKINGKRTANTQEKAKTTVDETTNPMKEEKKAVQPVEKAEKKVPKKSSAKKGPNIFLLAINFFKEVYHELKRVTWLTRDELVKQTSVVAGVVITFTLVVGLVDLGLSALANLLMSLNS